MSHVVKDLVAARKARGLTQQDLADAMGVSQSVISEFEASDDPRLSTLRRYAAKVGVRLSHQIEELHTDSLQELGGLLQQLLGDDEIEYVLYKNRSTDPNAPYATLALSAAAALTQEQYEAARAYLEQKEAERE